MATRRRLDARKERRRREQAVDRTGTGPRFEDIRATLLPLKQWSTTPADVAKREEEMNAWIRTAAPSDGVIDFDAVLRDPADPLLLNPAYDSGDHLYPDDAGYEAMNVNAISLEMLLPKPR